MIHFCYILVVYCLLFSSACSNESPQYFCIDIGVLGADESEAIAIKDSGQVLGRRNNNGQWHTFLWDKENQLRILNLPGEGTRLNNKGQIAGIHPKGVFLWDPVTGLYNINSICDHDHWNVLLNDNGQLVIKNYNSSNQNSKIYFWNQDVPVEISGTFVTQFPEYQSPHHIFLNNNGEIIISAYSPREKLGNISRSFVWKNGHFEELFSDYAKDINISVYCLDDHGNMLALIKNEYYFINPQKRIQHLIDVKNWPAS